MNQTRGVGPPVSLRAMFRRLLYIFSRVDLIFGKNGGILKGYYGIWIRLFAWKT